MGLQLQNISVLIDFSIVSNYDFRDTLNPKKIQTHLILDMIFILDRQFLD